MNNKKDNSIMEDFVIKLLNLALADNNCDNKSLKKEMDSEETELLSC